MPRKIRNSSNQVFDALAAPLRLRILKLVHSQGPLSYSEIMSRLNLNPNRDAGKFAYHLRKLNNSGLLSTNKMRKYIFTPLGSLMIDVTQNVEDQALKQHKKLLVRTSRLSMGEFDRNKIVKALMREAGVPSRLARKIAEETEERLLKLNTLYLTAPLIREFVNAILIEKGLHEYRHRHTRLGLPVHDVYQTIKQAQMLEAGIQGISDIMAKNVLTEYVLLAILPRKVADAHLEGSLHLKDMNNWVLKPQSIQHDIRIFLRKGLNPTGGSANPLALGPPRNLPAALAVVYSLLSNCSGEVSGEQAVPHFNIFLAPFVKGMADDVLQAHLKPFLIYLNQLSSSSSAPSLSIGLDLTVPHYLQSTEVVYPEEKIPDTYGSFVGEAKRIANSLIDLLAEDENHRPILSPHLIINITRDSFNDRGVLDLLIQAHKLAASTGAPLFANLAPIWQKNALYNSGGMRFATDWKDDWELDTLRTGALGTVGINLPRIAYEAKGKESKVFNILDERLSLAIEALKIKAASMDDLFSRGLLPLISGNIVGESYLRLKNASFLIGLVGLNEATKACTGKQIHEGNEATAFASKIVSHLSVEAKKISLSAGLRIALIHGALDDASQRLAELDVERYGWSIVNAQGTRDTPYYTDLTLSSLESEMTLHDRLRIEGNFQPLLKGGHLLPIELSEPQQDAAALLKTTKEIVQTENIGAYAFTRTYGYCLNCKKTQGGHRQKCPNCGAAEAYTTFSRLASSYSSLNYWPKSKAFTFDERKRYRLDSKL